MPPPAKRTRTQSYCVVLMTTCQDAWSRFADRVMNDALLNRRPVLRTLGRAGIEDHTTKAVSRTEPVIDEMRTDFAVPMLKIATDQEYRPGLDQIIEFIVSDHRTG